MTTMPAFVLTHMSWPEVRSALETVRLAIIPTGSCEQHGPNMTLETDAAICYALAERLAQRLYPRALLAPLLPWGVSPHHMNFPGTITLRPETYDAMLWDVVASLKYHGLSHFLLVNGHGGNVAPLTVISMKLRRELNVQVAVMFYMQLAADVIKAGAKTALYGHACEVETSVGLYLAPQTVKPERGAGQVIATLPEGTRADARRAIAAANAAKAQIAGMSTWDRSRLCTRIAEVMERRKDELARVLTEDQGKPYHTEALAEIAFAIEGVAATAEQVKWLETSVIPVQDPNKRVFSFRQPRGVYAVVTPWNFPINIPLEYLAPGLAAGNTIVWVPAPTTSVCAIKLMGCLEEAGVPAGVVNLVTGPGPVVGDEIVAHPGTDAVGFTGSPQTGKQIAQRAAGKPLLLELGGNGPTIVLDDADLELAGTATALGCFFNAGQVCSAAERILVNRRVHDELAEHLVAAARAVRLGDPFDPHTTMGPLNNRPTAEKMDRHLADGVVKGAAILYGGERAAHLGSDLFYMPTVIDNITEDSLLNTEETFGPVAPLMTFADYDEALAIANRCSLGLVAAVFTSSLKNAFYFAERLRTGIVNINEHSNYWESHIPFGGVSGTRSGIGRIGGKHSLMEMTDLRTMCIDVSR